MSERPSNRRIRLLLGLFALVFAGTLGRAVWLQGVQASTLERMAARQQEQTTEIPAGRGTIYDRTGEPLAIGEQATTVYADPRAREGARGGSRSRPRRRSASTRTSSIRCSPTARGTSSTCKRKADPAKAAELEKRNLAGLGFYAEELRYYPQRGVAAHVLGFAGVDNDGLEGLERSLDKPLDRQAGQPDDRHRPGRPRRSTSIATKPERAGRRRLPHDRPPDPGATPSPCCARPSSAGGRRAATAIVLDPRTGAVLAMAVAPGFDANRFASASADRRRNRAVTDVYEPGSTFKVVTVAAALSEKIVTPTTPFTLATLDPRRRPDHPRARAAPDPADDGRADPLAVVEHRHDHARADARPRAASRPGSTASASASRPASTRPASRAACCRATGRARRSATSRSARASA